MPFRVVPSLARVALTASLLLFVGCEIDTKHGLNGVDEFADGGLYVPGNDAQSLQPDAPLAALDAEGITPDAGEATPDAKEVTPDAGPRCGNGVVELAEACDDGNQIDNDGCRNSCVNPRCGDGVVQSGEACDDGNTNDADACAAECKAATCGDGFVRAGVEACDDGNRVNNDSCSNACALPGCGDGIVQANEDCDDGNDVNTDACLNTCKAAFCGDGVLWAAKEECDDGNQSNRDACLDSCANSKCFAAPIVDDANPCTSDSCDPKVGPVHTPVQRGTNCDDGSVCNGTDVCDDKGVCLKAIPLPVRAPCDDDNVCNGISRCNGLGVCVQSSPPPAAGYGCSSGRMCMVCNGQGLCEAPTAANLSDGDGCTIDSCDLSKGAVSVEDPRIGTSCSYVCGVQCPIASPLALIPPIIIICPPKYCPGGRFICNAGAVTCQAPIIF